MANLLSSFKPNPLYDVEVEKTARQNADAALQNNINAEATIRQNADTVLQNNINFEITARQNAETTLQNGINAEATARQNADSGLQNSISAETILRQSADATLQNNINAEATARQSADTTLQNNINAEVTARQNLQTIVSGKVNTSELGITVATLVNGTVPSSQLPSFVDDVLEYTNLASFPATGESGKIYVALDTNKSYRWSGSAYVYITSGAVDSVNGKTGVVSLVKADVGLGNVDNTADANKNVLSATKLTTSRSVAITGDVSGSASFDGSTNISISTALANSGVGAGTYRSVTVDAKGRVTSGTNPTTLAGYGITDALPLTGGVLTGQLNVTSPSEAQLSVTYIGQNNAYLFSNAAEWGLYSTSGGGIIKYVRSSGKVFVNNIDTSTLVKNDGGTYSIVASGLLTSANYQMNSLGIGVTPSGSGGDIRATGNITAFYSSDARLKENVQTIPDALSMVNKLRGVKFDWTQEFIDNNGGEDGYFVRKNDIGVIADELEQVLPELVATKNDGYKGVKYDRICVVLIEAIKELNSKIDAMQQEIDDLRKG